MSAGVVYRVLRVALGAWLAFVAGAARGAAAEPSPVVYPPRTLPLAFDHAQHARAGAPCARCHAAASSSTSASDELMPREADCRGCHLIDRASPFKPASPGEPPARCDACHVGWTGPAPGKPAPARLVLPRPNLRFNHRLHNERGLACDACHAQVQQGTVKHPGMPMMASCMVCHDGRRKEGHATARCAACHPAEPDGRLKTELPVGGGAVARLVPTGAYAGFDAHTPAFRRDHRIAGKREKACLSCHRQRECLDCHGAGVVRPPDIHPSDYLTLHALDARRNVPDCSSCHRNQTFCVGCHQRSGVASEAEGGQLGRQPRNPFGTGAGVKRFHPPGWARDATGAIITAPTPASHSYQARRNVRACASCHREQTCLECHSTDPTRSASINPHGPGFAGSQKCRALSARNRRACLKCHGVASPELDCD